MDVSFVQLLFIFHLLNYLITYHVLSYLNVSINCESNSTLLSFLFCVQCIYVSLLSGVMDVSGGNNKKDN